MSGINLDQWLSSCASLVLINGLVEYCHGASVHPVAGRTYIIIFSYAPHLSSPPVCIFPSLIAHLINAYFGSHSSYVSLLSLKLPSFQADTSAPLTLHTE